MLVASVQVEARHRRNNHVSVTSEQRLGTVRATHGSSRGQHANE
jgi:hypothetical protein